MIKDTDDWNKLISSTERRWLRTEQRIKRRIEKMGDVNLGRRNSLYKAQLKRKATEAEVAFGFILANSGVTPFSFQKGFFVPFHRIYDFYLPGHKIAFEIDGGYHLAIAEKDQRKDDWFKHKRGIRTFRFTNEQVLQNPDEVAKAVLDVV